METQVGELPKCWLLVNWGKSGQMKSYHERIEKSVRKKGVPVNGHTTQNTTVVFWLRLATCIANLSSFRQWYRICIRKVIWKACGFRCHDGLRLLEDELNSNIFLLSTGLFGEVAPCCMLPNVWSSMNACHVYTDTIWLPHNLIWYVLSLYVDIQVWLPAIQVPKWNLFQVVMFYAAVHAHQLENSWNEKESLCERPIWDQWHDSDS